MQDAQLLREARENAGLAVEQAAELLGAEGAELASIEAGERLASPSLLDGYARAFGLSLTDFMRGEASGTASALLFRSLRDAGPSFSALAGSGALLTLGDFLRCVRGLAEVRALLGETRQWRTVFDAVSVPEAPRDNDLLPRAEALAMRVRERLGLGQAPIASMKSVFDRLGIDVFWVTPDELDVDIDAGSTVSPTPAVLVNLVGGAEQWWRTRMTLAHELCHLVFDRSFFGATNPFVVVSPASEKKRSSRLGLPTAHELLEKRARAFAVHFLVPRVELNSLLAGRDAASEAAVTAVCQHFQVGRITAINQLRNVGAVSDVTRHGMLLRKPGNVLPKNHPDASAAGSPGLRSGVLGDVVLRGVAAGKLSPLRARSLLDLAPSDPLPPGAGLSDDQRAPLLSSEDRVRKVAVRRLLANRDTADCYVDAITLVDGAWHVRVARGNVACGTMMIGTDLQIVTEQVKSPAR